jgi:outer membrane lipoprotein-sorting protein
MLRRLPLRRPSAGFGEPATLAAAERRAERPLTFFERVKAMPWKTKSAAALAMAACIAVVAFVAVDYPGASLAWGQVVEKLRSAKTMSFDSVLKNESDRTQLSRSRTYFKVPGRMRTETEMKDQKGFVVFDMPAGKVLMADSVTKTARVSPLEGVEGKDIAAYEIEALQKLREDQSRPLGEKTIGGVPVRGFEIVTDNVTTTVWADAKTGAPVEVEFLHKNHPVGSQRQTWTNIKLDEPLDDSLFSVEPPAGYEAKPFLPVNFNAAPAEHAANFLKIYVKFMDGKYPPSLQGAGPLLHEKFKRENFNAASADTREMAMQLSFHGAAMMAAIMKGKEGVDWKYYPATAPGENEKVLCWFRNPRDGVYTAIYGDLHLAPIEKEALPTKPREDDADRTN